MPLRALAWLARLSVLVGMLHLIACAAPAITAIPATPVATPLSPPPAQRVGTALSQPQTTQPPSATASQPHFTYIAVPPDSWTLAVGEGFLWLTHGENQVSRLDLDMYQLVGAPITLDSLSGRIITAQGAAWVVASKSSEDVLEIRVWSIDPQKGTVQPIIAKRLNSNGNHIAVTGDTLWLTDPAELTGSRLWRFDLQRIGNEGQELPIGTEPLALLEAAGALWTANHDEGTLNRLNLATGEIEATIVVGYSLHGLTFGEGLFWTANWHNQTVSRVDPATNQVVGLPIQVGLAPTTMAAAPGAIWVGAHTSVRDPIDDRIARIDTATRKVVETLHVGGRIRDMIFANGALWVLTGEPDRLVRIE